ncbi:Uncharacterised protein [uncultured Clostridium sp.]|uniref:hypothetical protein n=1 Tax=uncultured Clostridium sp. TaxID=59620 RepID=UPI0008208AEE|nr:hypothetical protein [uncultured Clostridium sp.]SCK04409.1 Uncharacterised protein [uncultured Clostridium sp.]
MGVFKIEANNLCWIDSSIDNPDDLCLHGNVIVKIGDEIYRYNATVSATALYLLKSLTEDHIIYDDIQMLPCCGFSIISNDDLTNVDIVGCNDGIDWSILHENDYVKIVTEKNNEIIVSIDEYRYEVYKFVDEIELYYNKCKPKNLPYDEVDKNGYIAFWNEWNRRRNRNLQKENGFR